MDPKAYEKSVDELATLKQDIRDQYPAFKACRRIFDDVFQRDARELMALADMKFFRDGYPDPEGVSKLHKFLDKVALLVHFYQFLGDNEIVQYLKTKGVDVSNSVQLVDMALNPDVIDPAEWDDAMGAGSSGIPDRSKAVLETILDRMEDLMKGVYDTKETIREKAEAVEQKEGIKKSYVEKAASIRVKQNSNKPIEKDIAKVNRDASSAEQSISIFEDKKP